MPLPKIPTKPATILLAKDYPRAEPGKSPVRAAAKAENDRLSDRIRQLEIELDSANQALARATSEVVETRTDLVSARADLERWRHELAVMREKLEAADKDNLSTLQTTVTLLQQLVAKEEGHDEGE